nr:uncharacterized protein LOC107449336 [Parasteatoda tepidariorum]
MRLNSERSNEFRLSLLSRIRSTSTREFAKPSNSRLIQYQRKEMVTRLSLTQHVTHINTARISRTRDLNINSRQYFNIKNNDNRKIYGNSDNRKLLVSKISPSAQLIDNHLFEGQNIFKEDTYSRYVNSVVTRSSPTQRKISKTESFSRKEMSLSPTQKNSGLFDQLFLRKNTAFSLGFDVLLGLVILAFVIDDSDKGFLSRFKNQFNGLRAF